MSNDLFAPPSKDELQDDLFAPPSKDELTYAADKIDPKPTGAESFMAAGAQGATLGHADELAGLLGAAWDKGEALLGLRGDIDFADAYKTRRDVARGRDEQQKKANPGLYTAGEIGGGLLSAAATGGAANSVVNAAKVGKTLSAADKTRRALGLATMGGATAGSGYSKGDLGSGQHAFDTLVGGALGAGTFGLAKGAEKLARGTKNILDEVDFVKKAKDYVARKLEQSAGERAAKAAIGQNKKAYMELANRKGGVEGFGRKLLDTKLANGKRLIRFGNNVDDIGEKAIQKVDELAPQYDEIYSQIDELVPDGAVNKDKIAEAIMAKADTEYNQVANKNVRDRLYKEAEGFMDLPNDLSMRAAQSERNAYKWTPGKGMPGPTELSPKVQNDIKHLIGKQMDDAAENASPEIAARLKNLKADYGPVKQTAKLAEERRIADLSNRFVSPSDHAVGLAGLMSNLGALPSMALGFANKQLRTRGNSMAAISADALSKAVKQMPEAFGKYANVIEQASAKGAPQLSLVHQILWKNEPEYRALFSVDRVGDEKSMSAKTLGE
jgi:hypothetical protein